jgi:MerR family transcriptional regulator, aldehyde-responsive regulator
MKIGLVSENTGLSVHAIRYYEKQRLIRPAEKDGSGHRYYSDRDIELLNWILCMKNSGMSLTKIRLYAEAFYQQNSAQCLALLQEHLQNLQQKQQQLKHYLRVTSHKIKKLKQRLTFDRSLRLTAGDFV